MSSSTTSGAGRQGKRSRVESKQETKAKALKTAEDDTAGSAEAEEAEDDASTQVTKIIAQFQTPQGDKSGPQVELPANVTTEQLLELLNTLLNNEEKMPYSFFLNEEEIVSNLMEAIEKQGASTETVVPIVYQPQALFRVRTVTRCTSTIPGHTDAVLHVHFSPDGQKLASGSGDTTVRLWDVNTELPKKTLNGHRNHVLAVAWSPNSKYVASADKNGEIRVWDGETGERRRKPLTGHKSWVTSLAWEPLHLNPQCTRLASGSNDGTIKIWDLVRGVCTLSLNGHTQSVKAIRWGGTGLIYSASKDRSIKVWDAKEGKLIRNLDGHAHWVNTLALSTDYALRTGPFNHKGEAPTEEKEVVALCKQKYDQLLQNTARKDSEGKAIPSHELLVSGSDDFTLFLWDPTREKKPITRMTGHQQAINFVAYSPDARYIASASFDKSVKLWNGSTGKFITNFRAHVGAVYQLAWSADSRMLVSASKDSTMKVWNIRTKKMQTELPGHADEVYAVDWSPDGERVCSGGKDKVLKMWRH